MAFNRSATVVGTEKLSVGAYSASRRVILRAAEVGKRYGSTTALRKVDLELERGKVHALMGENGAGKSTLVKILVGAERHSGGTIELEGESVSFSSVSDALDAGIVPVYQHLTLFPNLSVLENLFSFENARGRGKGAHHTASMRARAKTALSRVGLLVDLDAVVFKLSLSERQLLEIARALCRDCRILILDEPTATLNAPEAARLEDVIRTLASEGVAVVYISHKTDEIRRLADHVTVLRDGMSVISGALMKDVTVEMLVDAMVGHKFDVAEKDLPEPGEVLVRVSGLRIDAEAEPVSFEIRAGEIVGIAGLVGSGAEEFGAALAGASPIQAGEVSFKAKNARPGDRVAAVASGVGYVPGDRHSEGLFPGCTSLANASASVLPSISRRGLIVASRERSGFYGFFDRLRLRPNDPFRLVDGFSGGNQQKVLLARNLGLPNLSFIVLNEPTRGVDIGARDIIHDAIVEAAREGKAVLLVTTDLEELTSLSHRILICRNRRIAKELPGRSTADAVAKAMIAEV